MIRAFGRIAAAIALAVALLAVWTPRAAAENGWSISRYDVTATAAQNGWLDVTLDFDFDFGGVPGHGPYLLLPLRQGVLGDDTRDRVFDVEGITASSSTGARTDILTENRWNVLAIRIGEENHTYTGVQSYRFKYRINGIVNPNVASSQLDEINWNAVGTGWTVPLANVRVTLAGPGDVVQATCYAGPQFSNSCSENSFAATTATFTQDRIRPGEGLQVVAGFPVGTFVGAEPTYARRLTVPAMFPVTPLTVTGAGLGALAAVAFVLFLVRRRGSDDAYLGLTPGLAPAPGAEAAVGRASRTPVTVQFTPPANFRPGQIGTLVDERADMRDVTATIIDLAVRGYLRIEEPAQGEWQVVQLASNAGLLPFEAKVFDALFAAGSVTTTEEMRANNYGMTLRATQLALYSDVTRLGWFRGNPLTVRIRWAIGGLLVAALGAGASFLLGLAGLGLLGIPLVILGLGLAIAARWMPARTASGRAVLEQARGFKLYLETAEADQIRWEEGEDIFSRYLPYAIAFGCADRWAHVFAEIAASGRAVPEPTWYVSPYFYGPAFWTSGGFDNFMSGLDGFNHAAATAMTAPSSGAAGGSGFGGGGGGGVGGGGGGGW